MEPVPYNLEMVAVRISKSFDNLLVLFCQMDLSLHMKGNHIAELNIYQAPVVGFAVKKLSLSGGQGNNWFKKQIQFDSDREFQVRETRGLCKKYLTGPCSLAPNKRFLVFDRFSRKVISRF